MALFSKIKRAFGFGPDDFDEDFTDFPSAEVTPLKSDNHSSDSTVEATESASTNNVSTFPEIDTTPPDAIFQSVVELFNQQLPPFIKDNLDMEAQRKAIYGALSESMKKYVDDLQRQAEEATELRWRNDRNKLQRQMQEIRERSQQIEDSASEVKQQQLSSERRKRALDARVQELQSKIDSLEAEKEQFELENKSLVNKLRTASVQEQDIKDLTEENARLNSEILKLRNVGDTSENTNLNETGSANKAEVEELSAKVAELNQNIDNLKADKAQLLDDVALLKKRCEIADSMINDLNHRASSAQLTLKQRDEQLEAMTEELETLRQNNSSETTDAVAELAEATEKLTELTHQLEVSSSELENTKNKLAETEDQLADANDELDEARNAMELFEQTLSQFEEIKENKNKAIADLKAQVEKLSADVAQLNDDKERLAKANDELNVENRSLKDTIHNNLTRQAEAEAALRAEIDKLRVSNTYGGRSKRGRPSSKPVEKPLDDSLDNTDWLISSPPPGEQSRPTSITDAEFGYHEPKRKDPPSENSSQMLLW